MNGKSTHLTTTKNDLLQFIRYTPAGLAITEMLVQYPHLARRTAQRWLKQLVDEREIVSTGKGRAHRYYAVNMAQSTVSLKVKDEFPDYLSISSDSQDILAYIDLLANS